jgi:putative ABC transport system ATP-binding protein
MPALVMEGVRKIYRSGRDEVVALDHAELTVGDDEMVTLVGPSGSGKTTLLSIAGGLLAPTEGRVVVGDRVVSDLPPRALTAFRQREVGFVFQSVNLVPFLTARENLTVVGELAGRPRGETGARADRLLEELGLADRRRNLAGDLSGGERQRVAIGRALMNEPKLVLVDEPTSALDTKLGESVMELLRAEITGRGVAAVIVTHDTRMTHFTDRTVEIVDGRLSAGHAAAAS